MISHKGGASSGIVGAGHTDRCMSERNPPRLDLSRERNGTVRVCGGSGLIAALVVGLGSVAVRHPPGGSDVENTTMPIVLAASVGLLVTAIPPFG
jgi:hypothetical protein